MQYTNGKGSKEKNHLTHFLLTFLCVNALSPPKNKNLKTFYNLLQCKCST